MMGEEHSLSGFLLFLLGWLGLADLASAVAGVHVTPAILLAGAVVCAGGTLLPDSDCKHSLASKALGPVTGALSWALRAMSKGAHSLAHTRHDKGNGAHRGLTHTAVFAVGVYYLVRWLCDTHGVWAVLAILFLMLVLAQRGLPPKEKPYVDILTSAGLAGLAWIPLHDNVDGVGAFLGMCVAAGCVIHCIGDMITEEGVPFLAPIPIGGQCWRMIRIPKVFRIKAGGKFEKRIMKPVLIFGCALTTVGLFWPGMWPLIGQGAENTIHLISTDIHR